jgi:hypothetical protein
MRAQHRRRARRRGIELTDELQRTRHVLVVLQVDVALDPPEQVGHERHVPEVGEAARHVTHVARDAAGFVEQEHAGTGAPVGHGQVGVELVPVVRGDAYGVCRHGSWPSIRNLPRRSSERPYAVAGVYSTSSTRPEPPFTVISSTTPTPGA